MAAGLWQLMQQLEHLIIGPLRNDLLLSALCRTQQWC